MSDTYTIQKAKAKSKKYSLIIKYQDGKQKTVNFGAYGMSDYTIHNDPKRKELYINRHKTKENWGHSIKNLETAGYLSRWILWNLPSMK